MSSRTDDSVFSSLQSVTGSIYSNALYNKDLLDGYLLRKARQQGIRLPTGSQPEVFNYLGAFVETPTAGMNENVVYCDLACFTSDHKVVTPDGIRDITELEIGDPIYTLNEETLEVERDTVAQTHDYENTYGEIHNIDHRSVRLSVTENHRFLTYNKKYDGAKRNAQIQPDDYRWGELRNLPSGRHVFPIAQPRTGGESGDVSMLELMSDEYVAIYYDGRIPRWDGFPDDLADEVKTAYGTATNISEEGKVGKHVVPVDTYLDHKEYLDELAREVWIVGGAVYNSDNGRCGNHLPTEFTKEKFAELLGWFISEGHVGSHNPHRICIAQEDDQHRERIDDLLQSMGFHTSTTERKVSVTSGPLARLLERLCGEDSGNKQVPEMAFAWPPSVKKILLETLVKGDGSNNKPNVRYYWTKSDQLRDDMVRLTCELGYTPSYWDQDVWRIGYGTDGAFRTEDVTTSEHNGRVYCVTGENNSSILVGKNGQFQWVGNSLYPNNIRTLNGSPETIVGTRDDLKQSQYTEGDCVWGYVDTRPVKHVGKGEPWQQYTDGQYKMVYEPETPSVKWTCDEGSGPRYEKLYFLDHDVQAGFLPSCVQDLLDLKEKYRGTALYAATKRVVNSVYGYVGFSTQNGSSRMYDWRLAEAITLTGRKIIQHSRDKILEYLHENGYEDAYACSGDTDATAVAVPSASTRHETMEAVGEAVERLNEHGYDEFLNKACGVAPENTFMEIEIESYAPRLFIPSRNPPHDDIGVKKRYIQWETWNDDDGETDGVSITGLEAERSDVAPITKQAQRAFAAQLRNSDSTARENLFPTLREYADAIVNGRMDVNRVAKRGGIGQPLGEYGTASRTPAPLYRGAKYASRELDGVTVQQGDKPICVRVASVPDGYPTTYRAQTGEDGEPVDAIAVNTVANIPAGFEIDWDTHLSKVLIDPLKPLLETRFGKDAWQDVLNDHNQSSLASYE